MTPLSFVLPIVFWNKVHGSKAPAWRTAIHYVLIVLSTLFGIAALIGACYDIRANVVAGQK